MSKARILIVEDDKDTAEMLNSYFSRAGYIVDVANRGNDAVTLTRRQIPDLIILDIMLPGLNGYDVCRELRTTTRTSHIPIIFLTQKSERDDRLAGLELGVDDYVTKPFDIEELKLRASNIIAGHQRTNLTDPRTGLPAARLIEEQLRMIMPVKDWSYLELSVDHMRPFRDAYGFLAADEVLRHVAMLLKATIDEFGTENDFIGHTGGETFVVISYSPNVAEFTRQLQQRFGEDIYTHYNFLDSEQGGIRQIDGSLAPMISLSYGIVAAKTREFSDIREITETASAKRRLNREASAAA